MNTKGAVQSICLLLSLFLVLFLGSLAFGQGTIDSITITPTNPSTEDEITIPETFGSYAEHIATQGFGGKTIARTCALWGVEPIEPRPTVPVRSQVPVLLVAGTLDSLTPPAWAHEVAATLENARVIEVEGFAHSPTFASECTAGIALEFLDDPSRTPDTSCLAALEIEFAVAK